MTEELNQSFTHAYAEIDALTKTSGFTMASDPLTCSLLRTLAASKPGGKFLELGTGTGLSTAWILDGMDKNATLVSIDNDAKFLEIAKTALGQDSRLQLVLTDGAQWVEENTGQQYDYIFADTWHGKYLLLDEVLAMLKKAGSILLMICCHSPTGPKGTMKKH